MSEVSFPLPSVEEVKLQTRAIKIGSGWMGHCPAHDDRSPSLSITEGRNGQTLLYCHAGCSFQSVSECLNIKPDQLRPSSNHSKETFLKQSDIEFLINDRSLSQSIIDWANLTTSGDTISIPIYDQDGNLTDTRRYLEPSKRKSDRPKIRGNKGAEAQLYPEPILNLLIRGENIDHLGILDFKEIILVEGELDALAGISNGFLTISNTCGANIWKPSFSKRIARTKLPVTILMDNDQAGESGAQLRYQCLISHGVSTKILPWPDDRPQKHDVIDELKTFGRESLSLLLRESPERNLVIPMSEVTTEPVEWIFEPYIARKKITILEGDPGIGKSFLALYYVARLSSEKHQKSLLISLEDGLADTIKPRLEKFRCDLSLILAPKEMLSLDKEGIKKLELILSKELPSLVVLDTLTAVSAGRDNNKSNEMRPFLTELVKLAEKFNLGFLVLRHLNKKVDTSEQYRGAGSIDITGIARSVLQVVHDKDDKELCRVNHIKSNLAPKAKSFGYRLQDGHLEIVDELPKELPSGELERAIEFISEELLSGPKEAQIMAIKGKQLAFSASTMNRAKEKAGVRSKKVTENGRTFWNWVLKE